MVVVVIREVLRLIVLLFLILLLGRLVIDYIQMFAREWRPRGPMLVVAEAVYTATDPPLKAVRKVVPPLRLGGVQLDVGFFIVMVVVWVLYGIL